MDTIAASLDLNSGPGLLAVAAKISLSHAEIARRAGINKHTVGRLQNADTGQARTVTKVRRAVLGRAAELREFLDKLPNETAG